MTSIHGHDVIHLIHDAGGTLTRATLAQEVRQQFGPEARFHTCSAGGMSLDDLLAFLISRGKVVERDGKLAVQMAEVCGHGDHEHH